MTSRTDSQLRRYEREAGKELNERLEAQREKDREANAKLLVRTQISHYFAYLWTKTPRHHQRDLVVAFDLAHELHGMEWHRFEGVVTLSKIVSDVILGEYDGSITSKYTDRLRTLGSSASAHWIFRKKLLRASAKLGLEETIIL